VVSLICVLCSPAAAAAASLILWRNASFLVYNQYEKQQWLELYVTSSGG
jgi:hypothetical protein